MLYPVIFSAAAIILSVTSRPVRRDVNASLVPEFGVTAGIKDTGSASCLGIDGSNGEPVLIPCQCPPSRDSFIEELNANVAAGHVIQNPSVAVTFPQDNSTTSQLARIQACLVTLQNLNGTGVGCPVAATTWIALQKEISEEGLPSSSSSVVAASTATAIASSSSVVANSASTTISITKTAATSMCAVVGSSVAVAASSTVVASSSVSTSSVLSVTSSASVASVSGTAAASNVTTNESLVPDFGVTAGTNPDGTGNCDGIDGSNGSPILIPCACPPNRASFIDQLSANVAAGHVLHNPSVALTFPLDNSTASQLARIDACLVTLQNLNGTGVGCPASSTTWGALQKSLAAAL